jgi:rhodanese-related sulfurtransferase
MKASELLKRIETKTAPVIIDPRSEIEFRKGHVPGAINAPVRKILFNTANIPAGKDSELVIGCMHGQRAMIGKWLLGRRGYRNIVYLDGWIEGWIKAGLSLEKSS